MIDIDRSYLAYTVGGLAVAVSVAVLLRKKCFRKKDYPDDIVILHQLGQRDMWAPSLSPFVLKFETYLRMTNIPYQNDFGLKWSSKGKIPWMTYNGVDVADTQFCIEYLKDKLDKDLNKHLTSEEQGIARAFQRLTEENLFWVLALWIWCFDWTFVKKALNTRLSFLILIYFSRRVKQYTWGHGIGRHSVPEILHIARSDLKALSAYLGNKKFLMGSEPSEVDAAVFGLLAQFKWHLHDSPPGKIMSEFSNLSDYCVRMKERFWPDWDDCITHGGTRVATK